MATSAAPRSTPSTRIRVRPSPIRRFPQAASTRRARSVMDFFYPLPNRGTLANGYGVFQQFVPQTRKRHRGDIRVDAEAIAERFVVPPRQLPAPRSEQHHLRGRQRVHEPAHARYAAQHRVGDRRMDEDSRVHDGQRVPGGLQLRQLEAAEHIHGRGSRVRARPRERSEPGTRSARVSVVPVHWSHEPAGAHEHCRRRTERGPHAPPERLLAQRQPHVDQGRALAESRRPLDPQHGERRVWLRREFPGAVSIPRGRRHRESIHRLSARHARSMFRIT